MLSDSTPTSHSSPHPLKSSGSWKHRIFTPHVRCWPPTFYHEQAVGEVDEQKKSINKQFFKMQISNGFGERVQYWVTSYSLEHVMHFRSAPTLWGNERLITIISQMQRFIQLCNALREVERSLGASSESYPKVSTNSIGTLLTEVEQKIHNRNGKT